MSILLKLLLLAATAFMAGLVPTLLFFRTAADRRILIVGGIATAASYVAVGLGIPPLAYMTFNGLGFYPVWAIILAFPVALVWRLATAAAPRPPTEAERMEQIRQRALERARQRGRGA